MAKMPVGVLMAQLGTPDAPTAKALKPYLKQFLSDRRVIDYPPMLWQPLLRGIILNVRPRRSAELYARIWTGEGSPLLVISRAQAAALQERLGDSYRVALGMTYGKPSIGSVMRGFADDGIDRILVLPMFPQFSSTTSACIYDAAYRAAAGAMPQWSTQLKRNIPTLRFIEPYYAHPAYIAAMQSHLESQMAAMAERPDKIVISFHGIPRRHVESGDPYRQQCERTADLLAEAMGWGEDDWTLGFQSRFGPEEWLQPYTEDLLRELPGRGVERPLVFAPGFVTDCLETLDELGNEGREHFVEGGGDADQYHLAPCLNSSPTFIDALAGITRDNAFGWAEDAQARQPLATA